MIYNKLKVALDTNQGFNMEKYDNLTLEELLLFPHDREAWYWIGMAYFERGDFNNASVWLEKTMNDAGNEWAGKATLNLGHLHQGGLHPQACMDEALRLFETIPAFIRAKLNAGILYFKGTETQHNPAKGKVLIEEAIEELQNLEGYDKEKFFSQSEWFDIGWMYYKENNPEAYKYFEKAIANCDTNHESDRTLIGLANRCIDILRREGVVDELLEEKKRVLEQRRKDIAKFQDCIFADIYNTVGLKADGTVVSVGSNAYGQCNTRDWKDIVAISAHSSQTVGLKADGTVVAIGGKYEHCFMNEPYNIKDWRDIVAISVGNENTVGLKADGTVVVVGYKGAGQCNTDDWRDIVAISAGEYHTVGLKADGTVNAIGLNTKYNSDTKNYDYTGQCDTEEWRDIVAIFAGEYHTVGLKVDGTVVAVGDNEFGQCNTEDWRDIVAISAGYYYHTVGLKADGTVVAVGRNEDEQCDTEHWRDIVAISASTAHTVGLKADGTVVAVGYNEDGQCDTRAWRDIGPVSEEQILKWKIELEQEEQQRKAEEFRKKEQRRIEEDQRKAEERSKKEQYPMPSIPNSSSGDDSSSNDYSSSSSRSDSNEKFYSTKTFWWIVCGVSGLFFVLGIPIPFTSFIFIISLIVAIVMTYNTSKKPELQARNAVDKERKVTEEAMRPECKQCGRKYDYSNKWAFPPFCSRHCQSNYKLENHDWS